MKLGREKVVVVMSVLLAMVAGGCSGSGPERPRPPARPSTPSSTTTLLPVIAPLTGLAMAERRNATRPALVVKIDNFSAARPQAGLDAADVVYEELAEGGLTRFVAVFHSTDARTVGPVRSVRPSDPDIVAPLDPLFAYSGGAPAVVALLAGARLSNVGFDAVPKVYRRRADRSSPQNLYTNTADLYDAAPAASLPGPPPALGTFLAPGAPFAGSGMAVTSGLALAAGPSVRASYQWEASTRSWNRSTDGVPHMLEGGSQISPANVVVQFTRYSAFAADAQVSVANVVGSGDAWVLAGGMTVKGRWSKTSPTAVTRFTDLAGTPIALVPGQTLIHLVTPGASATITAPTTP